mmetsp:Transcript_29778/g.62222  ORF Transcript_29778/g.62222 Transcript_29778/m.62222 type:complete len:208 (-) Transcript_29778:441-1064(-)
MSVSSLEQRDSNESTSIACSLQQEPQQPQQQEEPARKKRKSCRVQFKEEDNRYFHLKAIELDDEMRNELWYNHHDYQHFRSTLWFTSQDLLLSAPPEIADMWSETLAATYNRKITVSTLPQRQLAQVYTQADDLVGLEYYLLNPSCQADARARKSAINGALRLGQRRQQTTMVGRHLSVLSKRLSQTPQRFAHEIATAQSQALAWAA